jgi:hypothetical protein
LVKELIDYDVDRAALCDGRFHNGPATRDYREANGNHGQNRLRISVNHFAFLRFVGGFNLDIPVIFRNQLLALKAAEAKTGHSLVQQGPLKSKGASTRLRGQSEENMLWYIHILPSLRHLRRLKEGGDPDP